LRAALQSVWPFVPATVLRSELNFRWVLLRACAFTQGHTLCAAVLTTQSHQILCDQYPPGTPRARHAPGLPHCAVGKVRRGKGAAHVADFSGVPFRVPRRGWFGGEDGF